MTFLLDHDVPDDIAYPLDQLGHQVVHLRDTLPTDTGDAAVLTHAHARGWVLISCNRDDFLSVAEAQLHSGIIILIRRKTRVAERAALVRLLDAAGESGVQGNINFA